MFLNSFLIIIVVNEYRIEVFFEAILKEILQK